MNMCSGLLVEEGLKLGFDSEGIVVNGYELARKKSNVHLGVLLLQGFKKRT